MAEARGNNDVLRGHDERNVASLNFIPAQERLPEDLLRLERVVIRPNGQPAKIVCVGVPGIGLARGSDNDLLVALMNSYIDAGCPVDGVITTTAYALLKLAGLDTSGQYYQNLGQGLERVFNTTYHITDGWFDVQEKRYTTVSFRIIDNLTRTHRLIDTNTIELDSRSVLKIRLNDEITKSIRDGYIKPLNLTVYQHLPSVGSRTLYRLLDVYLDEAATRGDAQPYQLIIPMMTIAENCGLLNRRTDHVRKALERMQTPLLAMGYLANVEFLGRGSKTRVQYTYGDASSPINPEHVTLLTQRGVHRGVAEKFARNLGDQVLIIIEKFEERKRKGEKIANEGAYLSTLLRDAASIVEQTQAEKERAQQAERSRKTAQAKAKTTETQENQLFELQREAALEAADPDAAVDILFPTFKIQQLQRQGLSAQEIDQLRGLVLNGTVSIEQMRTAIINVLMNPKEHLSVVRGWL